MISDTDTIGPAESSVASQKHRLTGTVQSDISERGLDDVDEEYDEATWGEVCTTCCIHSSEQWAVIFSGLMAVTFFLYFFLFGLELLGSGAKVLGGCTAGKLFGDITNPVAGVMIGVLSTVLLQSSSTTTSIAVSLVGAQAVSVNQGIYIIMGANIGTSVTNTIVAIGHLGDGEQLERAFAGATVHDVFNFLTVSVFLPIEVITGYLDKLTDAIVAHTKTEEGDKWNGPIKKLVAPFGKKIIIANKKIITVVAEGGSCADVYPIQCDNPDRPTSKSCKVGLIACDKSTGQCPLFFQANATQHEDKISGLVVFIIAIAILFVCLYGLVSILQKMLLSVSTRIIYKVTNINGYLAILVGAGFTMMVQSSSITTSSLIPLIGIGAISVEQMYPLTLGANLGTCITAILAALVTSGTDALQVALAHLFFNISGVLLWYPVPILRQVPINIARLLGKGAGIWRGFPFLYIFLMFFLVPLVLMGVSTLFTAESKGLTVLGSIIVIVLGMSMAYTAYYSFFGNGKEKCVNWMERRQVRSAAVEALPEDIALLKEELCLLKAQMAILVNQAEIPDEVSVGHGGSQADIISISING